VGQVSESRQRSSRPWPRCRFRSSSIYCVSALHNQDAQYHCESSTYDDLLHILLRSFDCFDITVVWQMTKLAQSEEVNVIGAVNRLWYAVNFMCDFTFYSVWNKLPPWVLANIPGIPRRRWESSSTSSTLAQQKPISKNQVKSISHENIQQAGTVQHYNHFGDDFKFIGRYIQPVIECCNHLPSNILPRCSDKIGVRLQKAQSTGEDDEHYQLPHHLSHSMRVCQTACREYSHIFAPYRICFATISLRSVYKLSSFNYPSQRPVDLQLSKMASAKLCA